MPAEVLPPHLRDKRHTDWPWPFSMIPRAWTAFNWGRPKQILGNQKERRKGAPAPIGEPGSWQFSIFPDAKGWEKLFAWYVAYSGNPGKDGKFRHFRFGARWDDVDMYTQWPALASRKYTGTNEQNTST